MSKEIKKISWGNVPYESRDVILLLIKKEYSTTNGAYIDMWMWKKYKASFVFNEGYYKFIDDSKYTEFCLTWL